MFTTDSNQPTTGTRAVDSLAMRRAATACGRAASAQTTAASPFWRAMSEQSALWLMTAPAGEPER